MSSLLLIALVLLAIIIGVAYIAAQKGRSPGGGVEEPAFEARKELFSPAERSFFGVLEQAVAGEFKIFGKVRLGDLIQPARGMSQSRRTGVRNRINQKHVDFVLCRPDTLAVAGVVELDDGSHKRKDRVDRDDFVDKALESAGIRVLHLPARKGYAVAEVRGQLAENLRLQVGEVEPPMPQMEAKEKPEPVAPVTPVAISAEIREGTSAAPVEVSAPAAESQAAPVCPICNASMVKRQARKGAHAGKWFWACSEYPKCRKIVAVGS